MTEISKMSYEFHDWLEQCPVEWVRLGTETNGYCESATYEFTETTLEEEDQTLNPQLIPTQEDF